MALIVEDGSQVADAESFATVEQVRDFATARGVVLSDNDGAVEILLRVACEYLLRYEDRYKGARVNPAQALPWPRSGVFLFGSATELDPTTIPARLVSAQCQLVLESLTTELLPNGSGREVASEQVDVIKTEYVPGSAGTSVLPVFNRVETFLAPLMAESGSISLRSVRA